MIRTIEQATMMEMLLNSLEAERYVRAALLSSIVDELTESAVLAPATQTAQALLDDLDAGSLTETEFQRRVADLRVRVRTLASGDRHAVAATAA